MSKERYVREYQLIIDNTKRGLEENISIFDGDYNDLDDICNLLNQQDRQIADLEAKLARTQNELTAKVEYIQELVEVKDDYKQQLAEKECEIKQLNARILISQLQAPEEQRLKIIGSSCCQYNPKRDKISFAVELLEKVKEFVKENESWEIEGSDYSIVYADDVLDKIDNQIEELKKEMK